MRSVAPMKTAKIGYIVISALLCALGILLIAKPELSVSVIGTICGILLIVFGAVKLVGYFSRDLYRLAFQYDFAFGILLIMLGILILRAPEGLMNFICIAIGLFILTDGLFKIQIAMDAKKFGIKEWWLILLLALITAALGVLLIVRPDAGSSALTIILGVTLLSEGILNLGTVITAVKITRNQKPDIIEVDYEERED